MSMSCLPKCITRVQGLIGQAKSLHIGKFGLGIGLTSKSQGCGIGTFVPEGTKL